VTRATHGCPGGCGRRVPAAHFACRDCWWRLPPGLRDEIIATHGRDPDAHVEAMLDALGWYRGHDAATTAHEALVGRTPTGPPPANPTRQRYATTLACSCGTDWGQVSDCPPHDGGRRVAKRIHRNHAPGESS